MTSVSAGKGILVVDDEQQLLDSLSLTLEAAGFNHVQTCSDSREALVLLSRQEYGAILLDICMPHLSGETVLGEICAEYPHTPVIIVSGINELETAVRCIKNGAFDYLVKPVEAERLITTVRRGLKHGDLLRENESLRRKIFSHKLQHPEAFAGIITRCDSMRNIFNYIEVIAPVSDPVLITGETGTGKELIARSLHIASGRQGKFVEVNVAGLDDHVFADTLFGHVPGAFTDARQARSGLVEQAEGGTLFLDEIGDLAPASQVKLLKLIQSGEYYPLGSDNLSRSNARIVAATNQDLKSKQKQGSFRKDLFYRMGTYHVHLPPLRDRREDIPILAEHFLAEASSELNVAPPEQSPELSCLLQNYNYPGNIRELRAMLFDGLARGGPEGLEKKLSALTGACDPRPSGGHVVSEPAPEGLSFPSPLPSMEEMSKKLISEAMHRAGGNRSLAARMLGVSRQTLHRRLK
jgi:DNA-binding NtrC family response regulator